MIDRIVKIMLAATVFATLIFANDKTPVNKDGSKAENSTPPTTEELLELFDQSYIMLRDNYVDEINEPEIIKSAIRGMLRPLDPYSVYLEGRKKERLEMLTRGKYGGVGIQISTRRDTLIITGVMEDSPAYSEGLQIGDKIIQVDTTSTIGFTTRQASELIKGEKGTEVTLTVYRPSARKKFEFTLVRDQIVIHDVPYYGVDEDGIGYIRITKFSRYTARDFRDALIALNKEQMEGLVIDLRGNSGGLLNNAINILDNLVERNALLLSTKGRVENANKTMYSRRRPILSEDIPIAVLINKNSASASEIVAGTLQDLDRAVIIGSKSFGKGLVQSRFTVNDSVKLKLTTAKYYTPSGRLIQKYDYLHNGVLTEGLDKKDTTFITIGGRKVKGGGGITPDVEVKRSDIPPYVRALWKQGIFLTFAASYVPTRNLEEPVVIDREIIRDFKAFLKEYDFNYNEPGEAEFKKMKKIITDAEHLENDGKSFIDKLFFWKKSPAEKLFGELDKYYEGIKKDPFKSKANLKGITNGLYREISSVVTGKSSDRIKASLSYDKVYHKAKSILLDANEYYTILSPQEDMEESNESSIQEKIPANGKKL